jgi:hypothetical protein
MQHDDDQMSVSLARMKPLSIEVLEVCGRLFGEADKVDYGTLSPFVPYCLYQAAVVQHQLLKHVNHSDVVDGRSEHNLASLKKLLRSFNARWLIAGMPTLNQDF